MSRHETHAQSVRVDSPATISVHYCSSKVGTCKKEPFLALLVDVHFFPHALMVMVHIAVLTDFGRAELLTN